ncbi:uncharacterized protein LOC106636444 [Copidosoma floridanum]|uniref:uncharacterized protein LOC106636444 n=1 Tax=Copidosoma floridanum TaxID=29053 RepID=UPI000C6F5CDB|nr:uncharacterized protein LOC106636444 [Copidosoma floridanum]
MQHIYQPISTSHENNVHPILEDIKISCSDIKSTSTITDVDENRESCSIVINKTQDEAFQEANNYVCSEMLDCTWSSSANENSVEHNVKDSIPWPPNPNENMEGYIRLFTAHHEIVTAKIKLIVALGISQKSHLELLILKEVIKFAKQ